MNASRLLRVSSRRRPRLIEHGAWGERTDKLRVLIENSDTADLWAHAETLRDAGYEVAVCTGPTEPVKRKRPLYFEDPEQSAEREEPVGCPLLVNGRCGLVEDADVIVTSTNLSQSQGIVAALRKSPAALVIEGPRGASDGAHSKSTVIPLPATEQTLLAAVERAARGGAA